MQKMMMSVEIVDVLKMQCQETILLNVQGK